MDASTRTIRNLRAARRSCFRKPPGRIESTVTLRPTSSSSPRTNALNQLRAKVSHHLREVVYIVLHVVDRVLHRQGPVLLRARRHEHAAVALVQPGQIRVGLVDLEVVAVVAHALGAVRDSAS